MKTALAILLLAVSAEAVPGDADNDGIPNLQDKCVLDSRNVIYPCDTDGDGYGNVCDPDFDQNNAVNSQDFTNYFVPAFKGGTVSFGQDLDCNGTVSAGDFISYFVPKFKGALGGAVPGPSRCEPR